MSGAPIANAQAETPSGPPPVPPAPGANDSAPAKAPASPPPPGAKGAAEAPPAAADVGQANPDGPSEAEQVKVQAVSEEEFIKGSQEKSEEGAPTAGDLKRMREAARRYVGEEQATFSSQFSGSAAGSVHMGSGDIHYTFYGVQQQHERGSSVERITIAQIERTRTVYVAPPSQDQALNLFGEKHVLVLLGDLYAGKRTSALQLLSTVHPGDIFELSPSIDLEDDRAFKIEERRGYLIDSLAPTAAGKLSAFTLHRLSSRLKAQHSHLVITIDSRTRLAKETLSDFLVAWSIPPDCEQILAKHLAWTFKGGPAPPEVAGYCADADVRQRIANNPPRKIARLAELLAGVIRRELTLKQALEHAENDARAQVEEWFEKHKGLEQRTFMLALAVFDGAKYQHVVNADQRLQEGIKPPPAEPPDAQQPKPPTVFDNPRSALVKDMCAHIERGHEQTALGPAPIERIKLDNPSFPKVILQYIWDEYDGLRDPMLTWLRDLGKSLDPDVQYCVAAALGYLSRYDFRKMQDEVLLPWAKDPKRSARQAAALALGMLAWNDEFAPQILDHLYQWSTDRNNWRLCWTAAVAHGALVGWRFPREALADIYLIAQTHDWRLSNVVRNSVITLFTIGQDIPDYYFRVLDALDQWTGAPRSRAAAIWLHTFLEIARDVKEPPRADGPAWPAILRLACAYQTYRPKILALWRRALNSQSARALALEGDTPVVREWLRAADSNADLYTAVEQLIGELVAQADPRMRERLDFYFKRWATHPRAPSESAARIRAFIGNS